MNVRPCVCIHTDMDELRITHFFERKRLGNTSQGEPLKLNPKEKMRMHSYEYAEIASHISQNPA